MRLLPRRLDPSFRVDASIQSFGLAADLWYRFGWELATGDGAIPEEGDQGPEEVAKRRSQAPTEARHADASFTSRNEHARSRGSSMGVGVRRDTARSACWFRRISRGKRCCWEIHPPC